MTTEEAIFQLDNSPAMGDTTARDLQCAAWAHIKTELAAAEALVQRYEKLAALLAWSRFGHGLGEERALSQPTEDHVTSLGLLVESWRNSPGLAAWLPEARRLADLMTPPEQPAPGDNA